MSTEHDPHGLAAHQPGAKLDAGKPQPALVLGDFARALEQVVAVGTFGAQKYSPSGWLCVPDGPRRYTDAMLRYWLLEATGHDTDPQTDLLHAAHLAWNALARLELMLRRDTPTPNAPPAKRNPIAAQEIAAHLRDSDIYDIEDAPEPWAFREGVLYAEAIHGIRDDMPIKRGHPSTTHQSA